jgi:hypothetical protein
MLTDVLAFEGAVYEHRASWIQTFRNSPRYQQFVRLFSADIPVAVVDISLTS